MHHMWWAVWSIWRGDRAKLGRIAAAIEECVGSRGIRSARVTVEVLGDVERYASFRRFLHQAPVQTTQQFDSLRIEGREPELTIVVTVRRKVSSGVVLTVDAQGGADGDRTAQDAGRRVAAAISRGGMQWRWARSVWGLGSLTNYKPTEWKTAGPHAWRTPESALDERNAMRFQVVWAWTSLWLLLVAYLVYVAARPVWEASGLEALGVLAGCLAIAGIAGRVRPMQDVVLPAVEIAEQTPGRRAARRAVALVAPVGAALARALFS